jgi:L-alanine-DL-glutamate epimerase-like enolase superfamily enzyme
MKITALETIRLDALPFVIWVRVETDEGITGLGETFWAAEPVEAYIHHNAAPYLLGKDPRDIELHDRKLGSVYVGARDAGAEVRGNSTINIALWDIYARALNEPLWRLLGGRTHQSVPLYNTCAGPTHVNVSSRNALFDLPVDWNKKPVQKEKYDDLAAWREDAGALAKSLHADGIRAMKIWPFDAAAEASYGTRISPVDLDKALVPFKKIRDAVGRDMEIMVELHGFWTLAPMLRIARALEPYDVMWLEEPIRFNELDALSDLARHTSIPIAASERLASRQVFKQIIDRRAASIIMIDLAWCGGISEARKIANMAEASELPVTLHDCTGPVVYAASCALSATLPNVNFQEGVRAFYKGWYLDVATAVPPIVDGRVAPLDGPGLGLELKPEIMKRPDARIRRTTL